MNDMLFQIGLITLFSIASQWLGWRFKMPAIIFLLAFGFVAGSVYNLIDPEQLLGEALDPFISIAVGIILFEGALTLNFREIKIAQRSIRHLVIIGAPLGWALISMAGHYMAGLDWPVAITFGALLIVTGPTVIMPLLRHARINERTGSILKWEGIINDPIGAILAILAYEYFKYTQHGDTAPFDFIATAGMTIIGVILAALLSAYALKTIFNRGWVPEFLKTTFLTSFVILFIVVCNSIQHESGLVAVTVLGVTLANLNITSLDELRRFKESITIMLVSGLFILLTARIDPQILLNIDLYGFLFVFSLLFVIRPLTILISSIGTNMTFREIILVSWVAPRGIVAAAVAGILGPLMVSIGYEDGEQLLPLTFAIVLCTVFLHGLTARPLARWLNLAHKHGDGIILVGASEWALQLAEVLKSHKLNVMMADRTWHALKQVRLAGIPSYYGEALSEMTEYNLELSSYNTLIAVTDNPSYNALVCNSYGHEYGKERVFQLAHENEEEIERRQMSETIKGRIIADQDFEYWNIARLFRQGWRFRVIKLSSEYTKEQWDQENGEDAHYILGQILPNQKIKFFPAEAKSSTFKEDVQLLVFMKDDDKDRHNTKQK